jgi:hypothetical protein
MRERIFPPRLTMAVVTTLVLIELALSTLVALGVARTVGSKRAPYLPLPDFTMTVIKITSDLAAITATVS